MPLPAIPPMIAARSEWVAAGNRFETALRTFTLESHRTTVSEIRQIMPILSPRITFLHLSDIHMGHGAPRTQWDPEIVLQAVLDDLAYLNPSRLDALFLTGDLAFSAKPEQYIRTRDWISSLTDSFAIKKDNIFLVPGNHDVERAVCNEGRNFPYLEALRRGDVPIDNAFDTEDF